MTRLSEETMDGLLLEWQLASNPKVTARREAFWASVKAFREQTSTKSKAEMIAELKANHPSYILSLLEAQSEALIRDRYVMTFHSKRKEQRV
jgi:hypothetical protein